MCVSNAMTGAELGAVAHRTGEDAIAGGAASRAVHPAGAARPLADRARMLLRFDDLVPERQDEVLDLTSARTARHAGTHSRTSWTSA
jgi:succinate-semialdehyde dehydrogenase/glutarate-semialdehyde dehydrogenase